MYARCSYPWPCLRTLQGFILFILAIKGFVFAPLIIPAPFFTMVFHVSVVTLFHRPWNMLSVHDAAMLDAKEEVCP